MRLALKNVRTRLTLWYVLVLTFILLVYAGISISLVYLDLRRNLDRELEEDYEIIENLIHVKPDGSVLINEKDDPYFHERWFDIWSENWQKLYESRPFSGRSLPHISEEEKTSEGFSFHSLVLENGVRVRAMYGKTNIEGKWLFIRLFKSENRLWEEVGTFGWLMLLALPLAILIAGLGGYFLTKKLLAPVDQMAEKARKISDRNLQERLPVVNPHDELGNLAKSFNELLERIEKSFNRLKQFTSDAAHELRTPLTAIRSMGEVGLQEDRDILYYRNLLGSILEENRHLTRLLDSLLFLSRTDSGNFRLHMKSFQLFPFVEQTIEFIQALAEEKNQSIVLQGEKNILLHADVGLLKEALLNLLDNAIKYSLPGTRIEVHIAQNNRHTTIEVIDQGMGIPEEEQEKIFERFYRVDKARSREMGGSGLGLAIALWSVQIQGGTIKVKSKVGKGSSFIIYFPQGGK